MEDFAERIRVYIIEDRHEKIVFPSLLKALIEYKPQNDLRTRIIHSRCLKHKHIKWAEKIVEKYPEVFNIKDDLTVAANFASLVYKLKEK